MADYEVDVVVVGSGPGGSTFARIASQHGLEVMVFDKRKEIGNPVRCGEGLGAREVVRQGLELPKEVFSTEIYGAKVVGPKGQEIVWRGEDTRGWVLERKFFDKWLAELAVSKGAKVKVHHRVVDVIHENGKPAGVIVVNQDGKEMEVRAKVVVSAEGMEAHIARKLGFDAVHRLYDVDTCYEYEMEPYDHENLIELYFGNDIAPRGYVWIFPKANRKANVGIGIGAHLINGLKRGNIQGAAPKPLLDKFIVNHDGLKEASIFNDFGGIISVGAPANEFVKDNALVLGTAAKQVDPIHGGGIALAMEAGWMAAHAVAEAIEKNDTSKEMLYKLYEKPWRDTTGKKLERRLLLRKVLEKLNDDDLNFIFDQLTAGDLDLVMKGKYAEVVGRMVKGRPQLLKVLSALLG